MVDYVHAQLAITENLLDRLRTPTSLQLPYTATISIAFKSPDSAQIISTYIHEWQWDMRDSRFHPSSFLPCARSLTGISFHIPASRPSLISHAREEPQGSTRGGHLNPDRSSIPFRPSSHEPILPIQCFSISSTSPGLPPPCLYAGILKQRREFDTHGGTGPYVYTMHHAAYPPFPRYSPYPQEIMMYAPPRPTAVHEAGSQPPPTANHSPVPLIQMSSRKRKCKPQVRSKGATQRVQRKLQGLRVQFPTLWHEVKG